MDRHFEGIEGGDIAHQTIARYILLQLLNKGVEQTVPDDQRADIIGVQITRIGGVVDPVVRGRVHHRLKPTQHFADHFGVDPELIEQIDAANKNDQCRMEADQHQRNAQHKHAGEHAGSALPKRSGQIVVLAGVMDDMLGPNLAVAVGDAVIEIIARVINDEAGEDPVPLKADGPNSEFIGTGQNPIGDKAE